MNNSEDWYPTTQEGERMMYENINSKIDGYAAKYPFLTAGYLAKIHTMCGMYIEGYDKITENRATMKQLSNWFRNVVDSKQKDQPVTPAPVFQAVTIPVGASIGLEEQCREFRRLMKAQANYDFADGLDLMIEKEEGAPMVVEDAVPGLKISIEANGSLKFEWKKTGFDMLELQWRKAGISMWQNADKSTEKIINFMPPLTEAGVPEKFEFRAIYLIKNQRVGKWSPIYTETVG